MNRFLLVSFINMLSLSFYATGQSKNSMDKAKVTRQRELNKKGDSAIVYYGVASYYADKFTGRQTATGASYSHAGNTAACNVLPLGTWIRVTNLRNDKKIILQINDRLHAKNTRFHFVEFSPLLICEYAGQRTCPYALSGDIIIKKETDAEARFTYIRGRIIILGVNSRYERKEK